MPSLSQNPQVSYLLHSLVNVVYCCTDTLRAYTVRVDKYLPLEVWDAGKANMLQQTCIIVICSVVTNNSSYMFTTVQGVPRLGRVVVIQMGFKSPKLLIFIFFYAQTIPRRFFVHTTYVHMCVLYKAPLFLWLWGNVVWVRVTSMQISSILSQ